MHIKVKYFTDIEPIREIQGGDWYDLRTAEDVTMEAGDFRMIPLGVAMELPEGYEAHVVPRSSTYKNFGVIQANHIGGHRQQLLRATTTSGCSRPSR